MASAIDEQTASASQEGIFESDKFVKRNLYTCEILKMWNLAKIIRELGTREQCVAFAEEQGLIASNKNCKVHKTPMKKIFSCNKTVGAFICNKGPCRAKSRITRSMGTWFENIKIDLTHVFYLMYCFAHQWTHEKVLWEDILRNETQKCLSPNTISDWYYYCREAVVIYQLERQEYVGKIGGPGKIVQIDESQFGKRKYNKGKQVEGHWVLGLIEDGSEDLRLEVCLKNIRSAEVLVPLIKKHVMEGTTFHTYHSRAYDCLEDHGYVYVNHSDPKNTVVAEDGTHTQRIGSQWRIVKRFFSQNNYNNTENFADVVVEYLWRRHILRHRKDPFIELINVVKCIYKPE